jgi:threonine/homoserine/homoserine lactone efflux protein
LTGKTAVWVSTTQSDAAVIYFRMYSAMVETETIQSLFLFGIMAGSVLGIPIGPNGTLCLYRSMRFGWSQGMATAWGSVTAMFLHAFISFMLLSRLMGMMSQKGGGDFINALSGVVSVVIGIIFYLSSRPGQTVLQNTAPQKVFFINFISAFTIGIVNPKNIFGFATLLIAGNLKLGNDISSVMNAAVFGGGVFLSTSMLFILLIYLSIAIGEKFLSRVIPKLKYLVSAVFILTGVVKIFQVL